MESNQRVRISDNGRFFCQADGEPFFWLADTGWLMIRLTREEIHEYLADRQAKGFNVIQVMAVHSTDNPNIYGELPFFELDVTRPNESYWKHLDYIIDTARDYNIHIALVPVWGSVVMHSDLLDAERATIYGQWLAERYKDKPNLFWLNGGDERGYKKMDVWLSLGRAIRSVDPNHLMTFHPFGRTQSSTWFHHESWLDFNMFQSGHRSYDQVLDDPPATWRGEDNWRFVLEDYARWPAKPTLDGEPSYEGIPHGLHDTTQPYWTGDDSRRFAYWSVFAGACGHTYGHSAVMQMHKPQLGEGNYGVRQFWQEALQSEAADQMQYIKKLMLSRPYFSRIPDQTVIDGDPGYRYDRLIVTRGEDYLFAYTYTGRSIRLQLGVLTGTELNAWWFNPRTGESQHIGEYANNGTAIFDPPGESRPGNDWVLVLDDASKQYEAPGQL